MTVNISDEIGSMLTDHNVDLIRFSGSVRKNVLGHLRQLQDDLIARLAVIENITTQQRLEGLLRAVERTIKSAYRKMRDVHGLEMRDLAKLEQDFAVGSLNRSLSVVLAQPILTPSILKQIAGNTLIQGAPSAEWWGRQAATLRNAFSDEIKQGFLLGEGTQDLVRRIRGTATGKREIFFLEGKKRVYSQFRGGIMDIGTRQAEALVRTSTQQIANAVRYESYKRNGDVIKGVQTHVTLDSRTSQICMSRSGNAWDLDTGEGIEGTLEGFPGPPPWHFNCRSSLIPLTYSIGELQERATAGGATSRQRRIARKVDNNMPIPKRQAMDGQIAGRQTYEQWLKKQPVKLQREKLGVTKFKLWKRNKLSFQQMVDQTGRPLTVEQIKVKLVNKGIISQRAADKLGQTGGG